MPTKPLTQSEVDTWRVPIPGGAAIIAPLDRLAQWARKSSLWSLTFGLSCRALPVVPGRGSRPHLARAAGEAERERPEGALARPLRQAAKRREDGGAAGDGHARGLARM